MREKKGNAGIDTSHGREWPYNGLCEPAMHHGSDWRWPIDTLPIPSSMPNRVLSEVGVGDPKGVGVLTTRTRYSRKGHIHKFCILRLYSHIFCVQIPKLFIVVSLWVLFRRMIYVFTHPRGTSYPESNMRV